jgi:ketosteroid isomerase-like protein
MPDESTTPDLVELTRRAVESVNCRDLDTALSIYGPGSVWDNTPIGMGTNHGLAEIRHEFEVIIGSYEELKMVIEEILDLGNGVIFAVYRVSGRPVGSTGRVEAHSVLVAVWEEGLIVRTTAYGDPDEARSAAERLSKERAQADV